MATSGAATFGLNVRELCTFALEKMAYFAEGEAPTPGNLATARRSLNAMLKGWQMTGPNLFRQTEGTLTLTANTQSYTLSTKPYRIVSARYRNASGIDLPMELLTREEYFDLPLKSSSGVPTQYYFDPQRDAGTLYVWPVLAAVTTETIRYTYQRRFEDVTTLDEDIDIPQEWTETVAYNLALRLCDDFSIDGSTFQRIERTAGRLLMTAQMSDREPEIRFVPGRR
jgi:hypothetical protein